MKHARRALVVALSLACVGALAYVSLVGRARAAAPQQSAGVQYAAIGNVTVVEANGKIIGTAWVRYLSPTGVETAAVNAVFNPANDFPKDDQAVRRWIAATNSQEGVGLVSPPLSAPEITSGVQEQARREALARAVAKLGAEGYEIAAPEPEGGKQLLSVAPRIAGNQVSLLSNQPYALYFKRTAP